MISSHDADAGRFAAWRIKAKVERKAPPQNVRGCYALVHIARRCLFDLLDFAAFNLVPILSDLAAHHRHQEVQTNDVGNGHGKDHGV